MKLTASRIKQLIVEELKAIKEGMDPMNPGYRPIDDVEGDMPPPLMNRHQEEHDRKMKEDPSYREWFMSQLQAKPVNVPGEDFSEYDLPPNL